MRVAVRFPRADLPSQFGSESQLSLNRQSTCDHLGSFPFRSMTLGESLTSDSALVRECKTLSKAKICAFLTPEPCSLLL